MKLLFSVNPISGGIDKSEFLEQAGALCDRYGIEYQLFETSGKNDQRRLKDSISNFHPDRIISIGGDGTFLFNALVAKDLDIPIGCVPLGSANGLATEMGTAPEPLEALQDVIMSHLITGLDMIRINQEHYMLHLGDVGINARIVHAYEQDPKRGMGTYAKYFIEELQNQERVKVTVSANNDTIEQEVIMIAICNARKFGTGVPINTTSNPLDGTFELVLIDRIDLKSIISAGLSSFNEKFHSHHNSLVIAAQEATISFSTPRMLQLDGEIVGKEKELHVEIMPAAVRLITTQNNPYLN